jgi:anti-anti-sigma factor
VITDRLPERNRDGRGARHAVPALHPPPCPGPVEGAPEEPPSALHITCEAFEDLVLVHLQGALDVYTSPAFREHVRRYDPAEVQLVIDLTGVRLLDFAGLEGLMSLRGDVLRGGGRLGLVCPRHLVRLCWVTGLRPSFAFGETLAEVRVALAETAKHPGRRE